MSHAFHARGARSAGYARSVDSRRPSTSQERMSRIAFVFPGQGSQSVGMGQALAAASPAAAAVFADADAALGEPLSRLAWEGPAEELDLTVNAQPALLATSIAYLAALRERWARPSAIDGRRSRPFAAGHSMGQYSALVAAGVARRSPTRSGSSASAAARCSAPGPGARAAWPRSSGSTTRACRSSSSPARLHGVFGVANRNSPGQVVVSGERAGRRGRARRSPRSSGPAGRSSCRSASRPTRRSWPRPPPACAPSSPASRSTTRIRRSRQRRRPHR